jgi:phosphoglycerate kinase
LSSKEKPFTVILGGAKISDKLPVVKNLISRADNFLIGGAIANTFLASRRHYLGKSLVEPDSYREANIIWQEIMDETDKNIYLPIDVLISKSLEKPEDLKTIDIAGTLKSDTMSDHTIVDIGPKTILQYEKVIANAKRIFFNGNMGVSEVSEFSDGTNKIIEIVTKSSAQIVIGGGDTVSAYENLNLPTKDNIYLSAGGGATLEYLAGKQLPGLKALE